MPSPNDNINMKDALSATFKMRAKDTSAAQDGSKQTVMHLATPYPLDYGLGGCYQLTSKSATMAAGLAANSPIYAFRWPSSTLLAIIHRVRISAWSLAVGFTAGIATFDLQKAVSWSAADTGGTTDTITSPNAKLRASVSATALSEIRHSSTATLTAGTRTLDAQPTDSLQRTVGTAVQTLFSDRISLFEKLGAEHPLVFAQNEGFIIAASVPATGTWGFSITTEWSEISPLSY